MTRYADIMKQIGELEKEAKAALVEDRNEALRQIRAIMATHDLTFKDLKRPSKKTSPSAAMYLDPTSGKPGTGNGRKRAWMGDRDKGEFLNPAHQ